MKLAGALWTFFGAMLALFLYIFTLALVRGVTLVILWGWFVVPFGIPGINVWWGLGLMMIVGLVTYQRNDPDAVEVRNANGVGEIVGVMVSAFFSLVLFCALAIGFGAIVHGLM